MLTLFTRLSSVSIVIALVGHQSTLFAALKDNAYKAIADFIAADKTKSNSPTTEQIVAKKYTALEPGTYCYQMKGDFIHEDIRLHVDGSNRVTGEKRSASYPKYEGRFSKIDGTIDGYGLNLTITPSNIDDEQAWQTSWPVTPHQLYMHDEATLDRVVCSKIDELFDTKQTTAKKHMALEPGTYCYQMRGDFIHEDVRLHVDGSNRVTGENRSASYPKYEGRFSKIDGAIDADHLNVMVIPSNIHDRQAWQTSWPITPNMLYMHSEASLNRVGCSMVDELFNADRLTSSAYNVQSKKVKFKPGKYSVTLEDAVVRGDRTIYTVNAQANQIMHLILTSSENNAVFDVVSPDNVILGTEQTKQSYLLPSAGDYQIIVGGTRGNATYELTVAVY